MNGNERDTSNKYMGSNGDLMSHSVVKGIGDFLFVVFVCDWLC